MNLPFLNPLVGSAANIVASGNFAGGVASLVTGGVSSIAIGVASLLNTATGTVNINNLPNIPTTKGVAGAAFAAITSSFKPFAAGVPQNLSKIAATNAVAIAAAGAGFTGATVTGPTHLGSIASGIASGVNAIPGGQQIISSVVNNAVGATDLLPGQLGVAVSIASGEASTIIETVKRSQTTLSSIISSGLSPAAAAQLTAGLAAISSAGSIQIKLPTVGVNTVDRTAITAGLAKNLGNPIIPVPDYSGETTAALKSSLDLQATGLVTKHEAATSILSEQTLLVAQYKVAREKLTDLVNTLPQGDAQIAIKLAECNTIMAAINAKTALLSVALS